MCLIDTSLAKVTEGTIKLVKLCLFTMKLMFPNVKRYRFLDDSTIYCDGDKTNMMSMAHDHILKYNKTWYQLHFHATLPAYSLGIYTNSLLLLDEPIEPVSSKEFIDGILPYMDTYKASHTPREFMNKLCKQLGADYCKEVGKWLKQYMAYIGVRVMQDEWFIPADKIETPDGYKILQLENANVIEKLHGGKLLTRKHKKAPTYSMLSRDNPRFRRES